MKTLIVLAALVAMALPGAAAAQGRPPYYCVTQTYETWAVRKNTTEVCLMAGDQAINDRFCLAAGGKITPDRLCTRPGVGPGCKMLAGGILERVRGICVLGGGDPAACKGAGGKVGTAAGGVVVCGFYE